MLRRSSVVLLGPAAHPTFFRGPLLQEFPTAESFHVSRAGYLENLYSVAEPQDPFSPVLKFRGQRYLISGPVTIKNKTFRVPFIIDTGAPITMIHQYTVRKFGVEFKEEIVPVNIGIHSFNVSLHDASTRTVEVVKDGQKVFEKVVDHLAYLNLLGLDFLEGAAPQLASYISENISKYQPPIDEIVVTGNGVAISVTPKKPTVMHLKKAVKEELAFMCASIDAVQIIIKNPADSYKVMGDKDPLHANINNGCRHF